jgi:HEAT repeat protein
MNPVPEKDLLCQALCTLLADGEDVHRTVAAQTLGRMKYLEAVPELIEALLDEDEDVRTDVATALSRLNDPKSAEPLMRNLLGDPCPEVKLAAIDGLTEMQHQDLVPWLPRMLKGKDEEIVWDESEFYETGWDDWVDIQVKVIKSIARFGVQAAVADIVEAIDDEYAQDLSEVAFAALAKLGDPGAEALAKYAADGEPRLRRRAVTELGRSAVTELGKSAGGIAARVLTRALQDEDADVRLAAGRAIALHNPQDEHLEMLLLDKSAAVRAASVTMFGKHFPARLMDMLSDRFDGVKSAVLTVLVDDPSAISDADLKDRLLEILEAPAAEPAGLAARALLATFAEEMQAPLLEKLIAGDTPLEVRLGILKSLTASENDVVLDTLKTLLADDQRQVRLAAMTAIAGRAGLQEAWPNEPGEILLAALRGEVVPAPEADEITGSNADEPAEPASDDQGVNITDTIEMAQSVQPVRSVGEPAAEKSALEEELAEVEIDVQPGSTLAALVDAENETASLQSGETGQPDRDVELSEDDLAFMELTHQKPRRKVVAHDAGIAPHQDVRRFAARVSGDFANEYVTMELAGSLSLDDRELTLTALDSLAHVGARQSQYPASVIEKLLEMSEHDDGDIRFGASKALAFAHSDEVVARMRELLKDGSSFVRTEAIRGLVRCDAMDEQVEALLADDTPSVRLAVAEALAAVPTLENVRRLVDFSLQFEAFHVRAVAGLLATRDADTARRLYLEILKDPGRKRYWKPAIEALEVLGRPGDKAALAA